MEGDYAYRMMAVIWARCLLEWVRACKAPALVHEGSSPSAPIQRFIRGLWRLAVRIVRLAPLVGRWVWKVVLWVLETPVHSYRQY